MIRNTISTVESTFSIGSSTRSGLESVAREHALFSNILLDSSVQRKRTTWTTLVSFVLQSSVLGLLLLLPLWFTEALPKQQILTLLEAPPPPVPPPPPPPAASAASLTKAVKVTSNIAEERLLTPSRVPTKVQVIKEEDEGAPPVAAADGVVGGVPGGTPGGQLGGVIGGIISSNLAPVPKLSKPVPTVQRVRVSQGLTKGLLVFRIEPTYPRLAQLGRVSGTVVLTAIIGKDGNVERLQLVSGNPLLAPAAIDAVKQWRYKPFLLNGQPVEIETTVTVNFEVHNG